ncbi:MAG: D-alanine--D-alanine ligase [Bacteroidales bacterium]|nr:D-alanine--D-alanine ligase [Bacteroidales bacterium]
MKKKNLALLAGGDSGEYEVSINSAKIVESNLDQDKYNIYKIILRGTSWYHLQGNIKIEIDKNDFSLTLQGKKILFDVAFIVIHGTPGEDGKLQGYLEMMKIPYTSTDLFTSAATFKKSFTNAIVKSSNVNVKVARSLMLKKKNNNSNDEILNFVNIPVFVKPNKGGSSVGVSKVSNEADLQPALKKAFAEDDEVLVEEFIRGRELACGVIKSKEELIAFPVTEIVSKKDFFDYEAKYTVGMADEITPAPISMELTLECQNLSKELYDLFDCRGLVRIDFFLQNETFYFLEINTIPGLSAESLVPQQIRAHNMTEKEIYDIIIEQALDFV